MKRVDFSHLQECHISWYELKLQGINIVGKKYSCSYFAYHKTSLESQSYDMQTDKVILNPKGSINLLQKEHFFFHNPAEARFLP